MQYKKNKNNVNQGDWIVIFTNIVHAIGIPGTVVVFLIYVFLTSATVAQRETFIDTWFLLKYSCVEKTFSVYAIFLLISLFIIQQIYFSKRRKLDRNEIKRLSELNTAFQASKILKNG